MKYKIIGILACLMILTASLLAPLLPGSVSDRYHQHLEAHEKQPCSHDADTFCTHLPLVLIETGGAEIPGKAILGPDGSSLGYTQTADGQDQISAQITIIDQADVNNHPADLATLQSEMLINVRGRSSRAFDKSNYAIRLVDENGENNKLPLLGMDAHHEWALHGPYIDKTLIRNYMWYNIAGEFMDYSPNVRFCEVMLNGEYMGLYVMTETVTAGDDGARLSLSVNEKNNHYSGYLVELVGDNKEDLSFVLPSLYGNEKQPSFTFSVDESREKLFAPYSTFSYRSPVIFELSYPGRKSLTDSLLKSIEQDLSDFQKALYSYDYDDPQLGYANKIDIQNFVDYFLINEFTANNDAGWLSTFIYKDLDGKYRLCIWDFNSSCDNYRDSLITPQGFHMHMKSFFYMLFKDEAFVEKVINRYWVLREKYLNEAYLYQYVDRVIAYLGPAIDRNWEKWGHSFESDYDQLIPTSRNPRSFEDAVQQMTEYIDARIEWMDQNITSLRQYSAESKVKKFNKDAN
ncbi:MAG: CotH kinase family protein [Clostridia bacterium]|nr:CotH kinase family protein [Clostridia bacterium]